MHPDRIRFSQNSISYYFKDGRTIDELADGSRTGLVRAADVPPLRRVEKAGEFLTLDNRRLEAFRRAQVEAPIRMATAEEASAEEWKFTTTNGGVSVRVREEHS